MQRFMSPTNLFGSNFTFQGNRSRVRNRRERGHHRWLGLVLSPSQGHRVASHLPTISGVSNPPRVVFSIAGLYPCISREAVRDLL
jgi:hypothetical protein